MFRFFTFNFLSLFWLSLASRHEKSFLAVHSCTARDLPGCYVERLDFLQKATKRTKVFAAAEDKAFVSFVVFCLQSSPVHPLYEKADKLSFEVNRRRKQRYLALDFGHDLALAKHNLCSLRYLLFKRFIWRQGGGPAFAMDRLCRGELSRPTSPSESLSLSVLSV